MRLPPSWAQHSVNAEFPTPTSAQLSSQDRPQKPKPSDRDELAISREGTNMEKMKSGTGRQERGGHTPRLCKAAELRELTDVLQ